MRKFGINERCKKKKPRRVLVNQQLNYPTEVKNRVFQFCFSIFAIVQKRTFPVFPLGTSNEFQKSMFELILLDCIVLPHIYSNKKSDFCRTDGPLIALGF